MQRRILLASILIYVFHFCSAQNKCEFDSISPPAELGKVCDLAFPICITQLNGYSGSLEKDTIFSQSVSACSPFAYVDWYSFNYCGDSLMIGITPNNCIDGVDSTGLFAGLFSGCSNAELLVCDGTTVDGDEIILKVYGPNKGNLRLYVDGYSSSTCDYTINVYQGIGTENPDQVTIDCEQKVVGEAESCQGGSFIYSTELTCLDPVGGDGYDSTLSCQGISLDNYGYFPFMTDICYEWIITPEEGWEIIGDHNGPSINIKWFNEDSLYATNPDTFLIQRITLHNPYFDERFGKFCESNVTRNIDFKPLEVIVSAPAIDQTEVEICEGETYQFFDVILSESGQYSRLDTGLCLLYVLDLIVKPPGQNEIVDYLTKCPGSCLMYNGVEYCDEGQFVVNVDQCQNTQSVEIKDGSLDVELIVSNMINCINSTSIITANVVTDINASSLSYSWYYNNSIVGEGTESIVVSKAGDYSVLVSLVDESGNVVCNSTAIINVEENFDEVPIQVYDEYEWSCNTSFLELNAMFDDSYVSSVEWVTEDGVINGSNVNSVIKVGSAGVYIVKVIHSLSGCSSIATINVKEIEGIKDVEYESTNILCEVDYASFLIKNVSGGAPPYVYYIDGKEIQEETKLFEAGMYDCSVKDKNGCQFDFEFEVIENGNIEGGITGDTEIFAGENIDLQANFNSTNEDSLYYTWYLSDSIIVSKDKRLNIILSKDELLTLVIEGENSCTVVKQFLIKTRKQEFKVYCPNVFSPNGDGVNDFFLVYGNGANSGKYELIIYDRWGSPIYILQDDFGESDQKGWDGNSENGQKVLSGTYVYILKFEVDGEIIQKNGTVALIR